MKYVIYGLIGVAVLAGLWSTFGVKGEEVVMCTMDAQLCPSGSYVGRSGPDCEFQCPSKFPVADDVKAEIESKGDRITINTPAPGSVITAPITITGEARGPWYFEASFPVVLTNWDGLIIAETYASAEGEWMTEEFVPYRGELGFESPYQEGDPDFMKRGTLILQKSNASDLPEHDDALEIPVQFAP
jgi:hypothetical protein